MPTTGSIPDVQSTPFGGGALSNPGITELVAAAEALAKQWIISGRAFADDQRIHSEHCNYCLMGSIREVLNHSDRCLVGRVLRAVENARGTNVCAYCGPACRGGAGHTARREGGALYGSVPGETESDESRQASEALLRPERRLVCGAEYPFGVDGGAAITCDKEIAHADADARSDHWSRERRLSWPTTALMAEEMLAHKGRNVDVRA